MGIEETKDVIEFVAKLGNGIAESVADGKWSFTDVTNFIPSATKVFSAIEGIDKVDDELLDLDEEEKAELIEFVIEQFDIPQDNAEKIIEEGLDQILNFFMFIKKYFINPVTPVV
jgi:hypothetical protein